MVGKGGQGIALNHSRKWAKYSGKKYCDRYRSCMVLAGDLFKGHLGIDM